MIFEHFDLEHFWHQSAYADKNYVGEPLTPGLVAAAETRLGYRLPAAYVELIGHQNGGFPARTNHRTREATSWAGDHVAINGLLGVSQTRSCSLCGPSGSQFYIDEWGYPPIGVYFADCPSGGYDLLCLDYRQCGPQGEPQVVHVDQEDDYRITFVAENFEALIRGLEDATAFEKT